MWQASSKHYKHKTVVICGDFNSKHTIWGSTETDQKGIYLNDWITINKMACCNDGTYTHIRKGKKEVLDIMMISQEDQNLVKQWYVQDIPTKRKDKNGKKIRFSDHRGLIMVMNMDPKIRVKPTRITWNLDEKKVPKFLEKLKPKMDHWKKVYDCLWKSKKNVETLMDNWERARGRTQGQVQSSCSWI